MKPQLKLGLYQIGQSFTHAIDIQILNQNLNAVQLLFFMSIFLHNIFA